MRVMMKILSAAIAAVLLCSCSTETRSELLEGTAQAQRASAYTVAQRERVIDFPSTAALDAEAFTRADRGLLVFDYETGTMYMITDQGSGPSVRSPVETVFSRTQAEGNSGTPFLQLVPAPDPGPSQSPPWTMLHERALFGSTYDHVVKMGWNVQDLDDNFGRVWISMESNFETGNPTHPYSTELHLSMAKKNGVERRVFSAVCDRDADYVESGFVADKQTWETTGGTSYLSWGATGMDLGSGFSIRKATNNQCYLFQNDTVPNSKCLLLMNSANQVQLGPSQQQVLIDGPLNRGEVNLAFSTTLVVNAAQADLFRVGQMTDDMTIDLQNVALGNTEGRIFLRQAAAGGKKITAITNSTESRTIVMDATTNPVTINTVPFLVANSLAELTWAVTNAGGATWIKVALKGTVAAAYP